jgi:hypothetical protein
MPASNKRDKPRPLPPRSDVPAGMADFVITLHAEDPPARNRGRREVYEDNSARTASFRKELLRFLEEQGLSSQVAGIGETMGFPMLTLTTTQAVARRIEELPGVDAVFKDKPDLGLVH